MKYYILEMHNDEFIIKMVYKGTREIDNYRLVDLIDPAFSYHVGAPVVIEESQTKIWLQFKRTGQSLDELSYDTILYCKFLSGFCNIFRAIQEMNSKGFHHLDIKGSNITMDTDYTFKVIDFGLSGTSPQDEIFGTAYLYWPFEARLLTGQAEDICDVTSDQVFGAYIADSHIRNFIKETDKDVSVIKDNYKRLKRMGEASYRQIIYTKMDVYGLGMTLQFVLDRLPMPKKLSDRLYRLVLRMTEFDIFRRLTAEESLEQYRAIVNDECMGL
jgi:serine/threonine protein kinase